MRRLAWLFGILPLSALASLTTPEIALRVEQHVLDYSHFRVEGACFWLDWSWRGPEITPTPEVSEFLPDLIVAVYNQAGENPWSEVQNTVDKAADQVEQASSREFFHSEMNNGSTASLGLSEQNDSVITKNVDVIGSPTGILRLPFLILPYNTTPLMPYFLSALDAIPGRSGMAEAVRLETFNPLGETVGTLYDHWAYEFPREMSVDNNNDFKASVSIGLHAADLVTNLSPLHVIHTTDNNCGDHCVVANVLPETSETHEIWQEIYPNDHRIILGESDASSLTPLHQDDIDAGEGDYLFAVWRHYQGCIPGSGHVIAVVGPAVPSPTKR